MGYHIFIQVSSNLAENLKWMAWNGAWHAANLLSGNDANSDKEKEREYFNKIGKDDPGTDSKKSGANSGNENDNGGNDSGKPDGNGGNGGNDSGKLDGNGGNGNRNGNDDGYGKYNRNNSEFHLHELLSIFSLPGH